MRLPCFDTKLPKVGFHYPMNFFLILRIIAEFNNIQSRALNPPEDSEELMAMLQFVENARTNGMIKLNERIKNAMERLQYLMESFLFEQGTTSNYFTLFYIMLNINHRPTNIAVFKYSEHLRFDTC